MPSDKTAAEAIVQHLIDEGVKHVFGITGDTVLPILDAMYDRSNEIRYIACRLEHAATGMADGYSRVTGEPACALLHVGPGISNAVLGTWIAEKDAVPLVVLSCNLDTFRLGRNLWHEFNVMNVFREVTKWNDQMRESKDAKRLMRTAFQVATSGQPGPVHVGAPERLVRRGAPEMADQPDCQLVVLGDGAAAHLSGHDRRAETLGQRDEVVPRPGPHDAAPGDDHRMLGPGHEPAGARERVGVGPRAVGDVRRLRRPGERLVG